MSGSRRRPSPLTSWPVPGVPGAVAAAAASARGNDVIDCNAAAAATVDAVTSADCGGRVSARTTACGGVVSLLLAGDRGVVADGGVGAAMTTTSASPAEMSALAGGASWAWAASSE